MGADLLVLDWGRAYRLGRPSSGRGTDRILGSRAPCVLNPVSLQLVTSHALHGSTWFTAAALSADVVWVASSSGRPRPIGFVVGAGAGLIAGANVASDPLTAPVAILPAIVMLAIMAWRGKVVGRKPIAEQAAVLLAVAGALGSRWVGHAMGITADLLPGKLATLDQMWPSLLQSADNAMSFFGPAPFGGDVSAMGAVRLVVGVIGFILSASLCSYAPRCRR